MRVRLAALATLLALASPATLWAHVHLRKSEPAAGAQLTQSPAAVTLWFSQAPELRMTRIVLVGPARDTIQLGTVTRPVGHPDAVSAVVPVTLAPGVYAIVWRTASSDGHLLRGRIQFTVGLAPGAVQGLAPAPGGDRLVGRVVVTPPATDSTVPAAAPTPPEREAEPAATEEQVAGRASAIAYAATRWLEFVGIFTLVGAVFFRRLILLRLRRRPSAMGEDYVDATRSTRRVAGAGALALLAALLGRLYIESRLVDGGAPLDPAVVGSLLVGTQWGVGWLVGAGSLLVALVGLTIARRAGGQWGLVELAVLGLVTAPALSGHAGATPGGRAALAVATDAVHVLGAAGWIGTLLLVVAVGIPTVLRGPAGLRGRGVADLIGLFSPIALLCAGLVVASGAVSTWLRVGSLDALLTSGYGRTLLLKLAVFSLVLGTGAYNWLRVKPTLGDERAARRIRRSATVELLIAAVVLGVTAALISIAPPVH